MAISGQQFRDTMRHFASGVTIVTAGRGAATHGMTVSAFVSVSAEPPIVGVVIDRAHSIHPLMGDGEGFAVNVLAQDQRELANRFAFIKDEDRFDGGTWITAVTGAPILADGVCWLDCRVVGCHEAGSHTIYLGSVEACAEPRASAPPLVYWDRDYRSLV